MDNSSLTGLTPTWCPGCGNWGVINALKKALGSLSLDASNIFIAFDIGCSGNANDFVNAYSMHTLHGRSVASAVGMKLARADMPVIAWGGDGAIYGEGGNHFMHACRGNHDLTIIVDDNMVYGLTNGQVAPTANKMYKSPSTPMGIIESPINPLVLAISQGATFVAQGFANNPALTSQLIAEGIKHKGLSLVNILQPCVTFNRVNTYQYFMKRVYELPIGYNPEDREAAVREAFMPSTEERFPLGIIYRNEKIPPYHKLIHPDVTSEPLVLKKRELNLEPIISAFM